MKNDAMLHKKTAILLILEILKKYTDESYDSEGNPAHCLTQAQIREKLKSDYDLELDRKAVSRNLNDLIVSCEGKIEYDEVPRSFKDGDPDEGNMKTNFRYVHDFDPGQIRMLINAVLFSNSLSEWECTELIEKISRLGGLEQRSRKQKYLYNLSLYSGDKVSNDSLLETLDVLDEAIDKGRQVAYVYNYYGKDKKLHPKLAGGEPVVRVVNPYRMVANNGRFYLICNYDEYDNVTNVRVDKITNIDILDTPRKPKKNVNGLKDEPSTIAEQLYMQPGAPERVVFRANNSENTISTVVDWFGKSVEFRDEDEKSVICEVKTNPSAMRFWAMQYSDYVEVLEPESLREEIRISLREAWRKYNDSKDTLIESDENIRKLISEWQSIWEDAGKLKTDVKRLGEAVRKTHLIFLPYHGKRLTGMYAELMRTLMMIEKTRSKTQPGVYAVSSVAGALIREVKNPAFNEEKGVPDDTLVVICISKDEGLFDLYIDLNNFEEDYHTLSSFASETAREFNEQSLERMKALKIGGQILAEEDKKRKKTD